MIHAVYFGFKTCVFIFILLVWGQLLAPAQPAFYQTNNGNYTLRVNAGGAVAGPADALEFPKGSGKIALKALHLWIGAKDASGNLTMAVSDPFRNLYDFSFGPVDTINGNTENQQNWKKVWGMDTSETGSHFRNWNTPGYQTPPGISTWPGSYSGSLAANPILGPFLDKNLNRQYEPQLGEIPIISGEEQAYMIMNDAIMPKDASATASILAEIYLQIFQYPNSFPDFPVFFIRARIVNRSRNSYDSLRIGWLSQFNIGNPTDDFCGSDSVLNMIYSYNGRAEDTGPGGYGGLMPASGFLLLNQAMQNSMVLPEVSDERRPPQNANEYWNFLNSKWADGKPLQRQGEGYLGVNLDTRFAFSGNICQPTGWTEPGELNAPGPRNMLAASAFSRWAPGEVLVVDAAIFATKLGSNDRFNTVCELLQTANQVTNFYKGNVSTRRKPPSPIVNVFPNPVKSGCQIFIGNEKIWQKVGIQDLTGKEIFSQAVPHLHVTPPHLPAGLYLLIFEDIDGIKYPLRLIVE